MRLGLVKVGAGVAVGWTAGYLFDPARGRARRARLRDQLAAHLRRDAHRIGQRARYQRGRLGGGFHRLRHPGPSSEVDDRVLADRVRSQGLGPLGDLAHGITIDVSERVVTVRGQVDDGVDIIRVETALHRVPGVERVVNLLHPAGETAPNKADARRAGA
jgi:hypothetical protein